MTTQLLTRLRIAARYNGPPQSANGGYACGLMAAAIGREVSIRLYQPPPLDTDLDLVFDSVTSKWHLRLNDQLIAAAHLATAHAHLPAHLPTYAEVVAAATEHPGSLSSPFPSCFVCGPDRRAGDGLHLMVRQLADSHLVATTWRPEAALARDGRQVDTPFLWSALDCPGYFASVKSGRMALLGELCVRVDRQVEAGAPHFIVAWPILIEGRKHKVATALFTADHALCALGVATWLER